VYTTSQWGAAAEVMQRIGGGRDGMHLEAQFEQCVRHHFAHERFVFHQQDARWSGLAVGHCSLLSSTPVILRQWTNARAVQCLQIF
jgi:hypothetical protein